MLIHKFSRSDKAASCHDSALNGKPEASAKIGPEHEQMLMQTGRTARDLDSASLCMQGTITPVSLWTTASAAQQIFSLDPTK